MTTPKTTLTVHRKSIRSGAYWFGVIGSLSIAFGAFMLVLTLMFTAQGTSAEAVSQMPGSIAPIFSGWLFLKGRDAFTAIGALIDDDIHSLTKT